jgi:protocatechuate 3,4-dioxygenase beta subunit
LGDTVPTVTAPIADTAAKELATQARISAEIAAIESAYQQGPFDEIQPRLDYAPYRSSLLRHGA